MNVKKTEKDGIVRAYPENGKMLAWSASSGVELIEKDGLYFKDLEKTGELLPYEDWRLPVEERAADLASRLTTEEIAGLMLYSPHQAVPPMAFGPFGGTYGGQKYAEANVPAYTLTDQQKEFMNKEHIRHVLMITVENAKTAAKWNNELQKLAESMPHGIPVNISSDPRNGARGSGGAEFKTAGSDVSKWPEGVGFAACFDPEVVRQFAEDASKEYRALGITTALGPQIDLCTEPRWMRFVDTLGENLEMTKKMVKAYCDGMQTTKNSENGWGYDSVNTMVKHWPGGGTGEAGRDAHYAYGKYAVYPGNNSEEHRKPFTEAAFKLDGPTESASAVMPYYTVSWGLDTKNGKNVGNSYSEYLIKDLLREKYGFKGVVCTDWGITQDPAPVIDTFASRCFNMEDMTEGERCFVAIMNGVDQFGGNAEIAPIMEAYQIGCEKVGEEAMRARMERSAARLLKNIFRCGLFENPYLDPEESAKIVGNAEFCAHGYDAQRKSVVLLKNRNHCLPLQKGLKIYVPQRKLRTMKGFMRNDIPARTEDPVTDEVISKYGVRVHTPEEADVALVFVESPACNAYSTEDVANGGNGYLPITLQYRPYTAVNAREVSIAGGDFREDFTNRSYRGKTNIAYNECDLDNILNCRKAMGDKPVIVCAAIDNPMVMHEFERETDGIVVEFGVSRAAVLDVVFGDYDPTGRLPVQMPKDMDTVEKHCEDVPFDLEVHVDEFGHAYDYGFGMNYEGVIEK